MYYLCIVSIKRINLLNHTRMKKICQIEKNQFISNDEMNNVVGGVCPGNQPIMRVVLIL